MHKCHHCGNNIHPEEDYYTVGFNKKFFALLFHENCFESIAGKQYSRKLKQIVTENQL